MRDDPNDMATDEDAIERKKVRTILKQAFLFVKSNIFAIIIP